MLALVQSCAAFHAPGLLARRAGSLDVKMEEVDERSPAFREAAAADKKATAEARMEAAKALTMSAEEVAALTEASKSLEPCWQGKPEECPKELVSKFSMKPLDYFAVMRNTQEDPPPAVWVGVRSMWPVLAERSDEDLLAALEPIKAVPVDRRYL